jgi:type II secretory pathway component GspD/PulD (secretin)
MKTTYEFTRWPHLRLACTLLALPLTLVLAAPPARAQETKASDEKAAVEINQTFFFHNITQQNELNDIQTDLRNMFPHVRIFAVSSQNAISIHGTPEEVEAAQRIAIELDRPRKTYRITYTFTDRDSENTAKVQTVSVVAASGEKSILKLGSKVPIATGTMDGDNSKANTVFQYEDVGLSIEATVGGRADALSLRSKVEQSSLAEEKSGIGPQDPVLRQSVLENTTTITPGKPLIIGSLDVPGATRKLEISVVAELIK